MFGNREYLAPIFSSSIEILYDLPKLENKKAAKINVYNHSNIDFILKQENPSIVLVSNRELTFKAYRTSVISVAGTSDDVKAMKNLKLYYEIENLVTGIGKKLTVVLEIKNF